jgi:hypothetical protein
MTGKELIIYILANNLEDEPVYENGRFIGFITASEAAEKFDVGIATIFVWLAQGKIEGMLVGGTLYIPADFEAPIENDYY